MNTTEQSSQEEKNQKALVDIKNNALKNAQAIIDQSNKLVESCKSIKITDKNSLLHAQQVLSSANQLLKHADETRLKMVRPYLKAKEAIDETIKSTIIDPLQEQINSGKALIKAWNDTEVIRANEEKKKLQKYHDFMVAVEASIKTKLELCVTPELCQELIESINNKFPAKESFGPNAEEAMAMKVNYIKLLETRKQTIIASISGNVGEFKQNAIQEQVQETEIVAIQEKATENKEIQQQQVVASISNVRNTWSYEIVNEKQLPRDFLSPDPAKIKAYMSANKDKMNPEGQEIGGVRFFVDQKVIIR